MSGYNSGMFKQLLMIMAVAGCVCGCRREPVLSGTDRSISVVETIQQSEDQEEVETELMMTETEGLMKISVYVCGQVQRPGVYELSADARIVTAIEAAGGAYEDADLSYLNLAEHMNDGDKIYVPSFEETADVDRLIRDPAQTEMSAGAADSSQLVDLNTASKEELMNLPGIGESKAEAIIAYRDSVGRINNPDELMNIPGIKDGVYSKFKDKVCVD